MGIYLFIITFEDAPRGIVINVLVSGSEVSPKKPGSVPDLGCKNFIPEKPSRHTTGNCSVDSAT